MLAAEPWRITGRNLNDSVPMPLYRSRRPWSRNTTRPCFLRSLHSPAVTLVVLPPASRPRPSSFSARLPSVVASIRPSFRPHGAQPQSECAHLVLPRVDARLAILIRRHRAGDLVTHARARGKISR